MIAASLTLGAILASCTAQPSLGTFAPAQVTTHLQAPWSVVFHGGTPLVSERDSARILELVEDCTAREIGTVEGVTGNGDGGLLGMAATIRIGCTCTPQHRAETAFSGTP